LEILNLKLYLCIVHGETKKIVLNVNSTNIYTLGVIQTLVIVEKSIVNFFII
jgi:hypothetical protein